MQHALYLMVMLGRNNKKGGSFMGKKKKLNSGVLSLIKEQKQDKINPNFINECFNPESDDIYNRRRRSPGSGFSKK